MEAKLKKAIETDLGIKSTRNHLCAVANAQNRRVGLVELPDQPHQRGVIGVIVVIQYIHGTAQGDKPREAARMIRNTITAIGPYRLCLDT